MMSWLRTLAYRDESEGALGRHATLLASLVLLLVALPLGQSLSGSTPRFPFLLGLVLVAAIVVNSRQRWMFVVATIVGGAAVAGGIATAFVDSTALRVAVDLLGLGLLGTTTLVMANSLIQTEQVSGDTIVGGICVYLLIGLCFAMTFILMTEISAGSFLIGGEPIARTLADPFVHATQLLYFSFVTLTTLGYGDVAPATEMAQMFAVSEAIVGQLYLTIFLARLVALFVSESRAA